MMKRSAIMLVGVGCALAGSARSAQAASAEQSCIRPGSGVTRIAASTAAPVDCCAGRMRCSQFLSTIVVSKPGRAART